MAVAGAGAFLLYRTKFGRRCVAVGANAEVARYAGIPVGRIRTLAFVIQGICVGIAVLIYVPRLGAATPTTGVLWELQVITAVVIGGLSLFGGRGSILGMLFGALIVGVFSLGLRLIGTDPQWTYLLIGVLIITAVAIDQWIRKVAG